MASPLTRASSNPKNNKQLLFCLSLLRLPVERESARQAAHLVGLFISPVNQKQQKKTFKRRQVERKIFNHSQKCFQTPVAVYPPKQLKQEPTATSKVFGGKFCCLAHAFAIADSFVGDGVCPHPANRNENAYLINQL